MVKKGYYEAEVISVGRSDFDSKKFKYSAESDKTAKDVFLKESNKKGVYYRGNAPKKSKFIYDIVEIKKNGKVIYDNVDRSKTLKEVEVDSVSEGKKIALKVAREANFNPRK